MTERDIIEKCKQAAAREALKYIQDNQVVGLGSGSTMKYFVKYLAEKVRRGELRNIEVVPTSHDIELLATELGLKVRQPQHYQEIDIAVDGADEVDPELNLLKGGGAALTREKIVDSMARQVIIIVDYRKLVDRLCTRHPLPIEVLPQAVKYVMKRVSEVIPCKDMRLREGTGKVGPVVTDNGNLILDIEPQEPIPPHRVEELETTLKTITGVVEVGLFPNKLVTRVVVAHPDKVTELEKK